MKLFDNLKKKYNVKPEDNMPREVYGTPSAMKNLNNKSNNERCDMDPKDNTQQRVCSDKKPADKEDILDLWIPRSK